MNIGKTRVWNAAGDKPEGVEALGAKAWTGELPLSQRGVVVLGTPIGSTEFVNDWIRSKLAEHKVLLDRIPAMQDVQCAWLVLLFCASSRANYVLRNLPPEQAQPFAEEHDTNIWSCLNSILGTDVVDTTAREIATLPFRQGGLGLRSATRMAEAAYWASWVDSLSQIKARHPRISAVLLSELAKGSASISASVRSAAAAADKLRSCGMSEQPSWSQAAQGARPPEPLDLEPGDFAHGWQFYAANTLDFHFVSTALEHRLSPARSAVRLSSMGPCSGRHFTALPTMKESTFTSERFRALLYVRLSQDLPLTSALCSCGRRLDAKGAHRSACSTCGVLVKRGVALEVAVARICREAGARAQTNVMLRDMNMTVPPTDTRRIEVVANGLPLFGGAQLAVDTTLVSTLRGDGHPRADAHRFPGVAIRDAEKAKRNKYHELAGHGRCRLVVIALEVCGRWSSEAASFVRALAKFKAESRPRLLKRSAELLYFKRWTALLACSAQSAFAASLLEQPLGGEGCVDGPAPPLASLLAHGGPSGTSSAA